MKKLLKAIALSILVASCGSSRVCNHNGEDIDCAYYDLYTAHAEVEAEINASFADDAVLSFEQEHELRERWVALYNASTDSLKEAYNLVGQGSHLEMLEDMRLQEIKYYRDKKVRLEELDEFLQNFDIEESGNESNLVWTITNNSDKTIKSFQFTKFLSQDGKIIKKSENNFVMFSADQLTPTPAEGEENYLQPGGIVVIDFDKPQGGEVMPVWDRVNIVEEEE